MGETLSKLLSGNWFLLSEIIQLYSPVLHAGGSCGFFSNLNLYIGISLSSLAGGGILDRHRAYLKDCSDGTS